VIPRRSSDDCTYKIIRFFARGIDPIILQTGATLEEAEEWCANPETSSQTCTGSVGKLRTKRFGPWFDGREAE
jgi:hypothetical protein